MIQPHDDALVIAARKSGFLVKRVMIDHGNGADVMYPDLFKGLGLKNQDLAKYDYPLVSFDGRIVIPQGQISLPVSMEGKEVIVTFIVVNSFSPYTAILGRPWIHGLPRTAVYRENELTTMNVTITSLPSMLTGREI